MKHLLLAFLLAGSLLAAPPLKEPDEQKIELNRQRLETVILPDLEMRDEPLRTALWKIRNITKAADTGGEGINFVLKASEQIRNDTKVTLVMKSPTLGDALEEIGRQAHLTIEPEEYAIALVETPKQTAQ